MDKQKDKEKISQIISDTEYIEDALFIDPDKIAEEIINAGIGDVKQAVREFADKLIDQLCVHSIDNKNVNSHLYDIAEIIKKCRKEVYGE